MTIRIRFWLVLQLTAMALGMAGFSHSVGAATIVFGSTSAQGFGAYIESKDSLSAVRAAYQCATGNQCAEMAVCNGGGYATVAFKFSPVTIAGACGFSTQAAADAAALSTCGSACNLGDQWFDSLPSAGTQCGTFAAPNSGCGGTPTTTLGDEECLFAWAESQLPQFFSPAGQQSQSYQMYTYRFYAATGNYLAFSSGNIYVMGASFGAAPVAAGTMASYLAQARASNCH